MRSDDTEGATPIDPDEAAELIPKHMATREELNVWEQENILLAARWVRRTRKDPLADESIRELHRRMFDMTWNWAGHYRRTNKNIGIDWQMIPVEVRKLVLDGSFWLQNGTYPIDEAALRLHHRLVSIHAFPNGNGRHARLWCDKLLTRNGRQPFAWKHEELDDDGDARRAYIQALKAADNNQFEPLFSLYLANRDNNHSA